ncbi:MAG: hypothetical protein NTW38_00045 [Candidatus Aminicenantes bacterium]|nr:hypothetical protein [Candidatus Aminicenantes bacterium]
MNKALKKALRLSGYVLGALILMAMAAVLLLLFDKPLVRNILESQLEKRTGMAVRLGRLDYSISPFRFTVESLKLNRENASQKVEVSVERLEAGGDFWKLVRNVKPALDLIEVGGLAFRVEQKASSEEPPDIEALIRQVSDVLAWTKRISATDAKISISLPGRDVGLDLFDLSLTMKDAARNVAYSIGRGEIRVREKDGIFLLTSGLTSSGTLGLAPPFNFDAEFALPSPRFTARGVEESLDGVNCAMAGRYDGSTRTLDVSRLKITVPGLLDLDGAVSGRFGDEAFLAVEARARFESLEGAAGILRSQLPAEFRDAGLRGRAELSGKYDFRRSDGESKNNVTASLAFENVEFDHVVDGLPLHLRTSGRIDAAGPLQDPRFSADIRAAAGRITRAGFAVAGSDVRVIATADRSDAAISRFDARINGLAFESPGGEKISFGKTVLAGKGNLDILRKTAALTSLDATLMDFDASVAGGKRIGFDKAVLTGRGSLDLIRKIAALTLSDATLTGLDIAAAEGKEISFGEAAFAGNGSFDLAGKRADLVSLEVRFPGLAPLRVSGGLDFGGRGAAEIRVEGRGLDVAALRKIAAPFVPESFSGWELGGAADLSLSARRPAASGEDWGFSGTASLAGAKFNDPSFSVAGEGLNPVFKFEGTRSAAKGLSFAVSLDIGGGEFLWKSVYVPWSTHPLKLTIGGRYDSETGAIDDLSARLLMPTIGEVGVTGSAKIGPHPSFDLGTEARLNLGPLYSLYSQAGVSEEDRMKLEGSLGASLLIRKSGDKLSVGGRVTLADTNVERPAAETLLLGVTADLPIHYETGQTGVLPPDAPLPEEGFFRVGEFRNPFLTLKSVVLPLRAGPNAFAVEPLVLDLYGGTLELGRTVFRFDPSTGSFQGFGSLALRDIDISTFSIPSSPFKLTGKIRADFPRLDISPRKISVSGRGEADVFGGKVVLRDLAVSDPFDPGRSISLNVDLVDLDLKKLTDEIPFGEVTGIIRGEIRDLVITYKQPERFDFRIESVPRKGVPQTFSLKAVDNLTVLSAGQPASLGTSPFWMRYVRGFRYKKLGIVSTLRNDTFTLSGTIHEGGVEYLVKKPALFGISVINRMPGKKISFKEMTGRLKRIGRSQK